LFNGFSCIDIKFHLNVSYNNQHSSIWNVGRIQEPIACFNLGLYFDGL